MYSSHWLEDTRQRYVSRVTSTMFIKELRRIVMDVIVLIMSKPEHRITRPRDFQLIVIAVISLLTRIGAALNLIISSFFHWLDVIQLRSALLVIKVEFTGARRGIVMVVIDPIMNQRKTRIIARQVFLQLASPVIK
jgi:hypothetical protein